MIALTLAALAGIGVFYLFTSLALGWTGLRPDPRQPESELRISRVDDWLRQAGLDDIDRSQFVVVIAAMAVLGFVLAYALFGAVIPAVIASVFTATFPVASYRQRRAARMRRAQDAWPPMIEEIRLLTGSLGRSIPQALLDVGRRGPEELQPAFAAAEREWLLTTDFERTASVLRQRLADPTADIVLETLLVAHELGGTDLDRRLIALVDDRLQDLLGRKDAAARQAGARFARLFVLAVPFGMALAGMSVGNGRAAYGSATGQLAVVVAIGLVIGCWFWAGRVMALPPEQRVFAQSGGGEGRYR